MRALLFLAAMILSGCLLRVDSQTKAFVDDDAATRDVRAILKELTSSYNALDLNSLTKDQYHHRMLVEKYALIRNLVSYNNISTDKTFYRVGIRKENKDTTVYGSEYIWLHTSLRALKWMKRQCDTVFRRDDTSFTIGIKPSIMARSYRKLKFITAYNKDRYRHGNPTYQLMLWVGKDENLKIAAVNALQNTGTWASIEFLTVAKTCREVYDRRAVVRNPELADDAGGVATTEKDQQSGRANEGG